MRRAPRAQDMFPNDTLTVVSGSQLVWTYTERPAIVLPSDGSGGVSSSASDRDVNYVQQQVASNQ